MGLSLLERAVAASLNSNVDNCPVGALAVTKTNLIFTGCNIRHMHRSDHIHAEVAAITNMITAGHQDLSLIYIWADREFYTPCGSCLDWIFQFGGPNCRVWFKEQTFTARELMPYYPR